MRIDKLATIALALLVVTGTTIACSSSTPAPSDEGDDDDSGLPDRTTDTDATTPTNPPPPTDAGVFETSIPISDADVGDGNAGVLCQPGDTKETENNDSAGSADPLTGVPSVYCGRLMPGDNDFATFTLNVAAFKTVYNFSNAPITMTATVDGQTFDLAGNGYVYEQGKVYVIKVTSAGTTDYRLQFEPL